MAWERKLCLLEFVIWGLKEIVWLCVCLCSRTNVRTDYIATYRTSSKFCYTVASSYPWASFHRPIPSLSEVCKVRTLASSLEHWNVYKISKAKIQIHQWSPIRPTNHNDKKTGGTKFIYVACTKVQLLDCAWSHPELQLLQLKVAMSTKLHNPCSSLIVYESCNNDKKEGNVI